MGKIRNKCNKRKPEGTNDRNINTFTASSHIFAKVKVPMCVMVTEYNLKNL
jgi:hypothetical protein